MRKRVVCVVLGLVMMLSQSFTVLAKTESQLKREKSQAQSQLNDANAVIDRLSVKQTEIQAEINEMDSEMVELMVQIDATKADITNTETGIAQKESDIEAKKAEIEQTKKELEKAEDDRDKQYNDMKKRIQYIYEHGGNDAWVNMLTEADNVSSFLNRAEYAQSMHEYDRDQLDQYMAVVQTVTDLKTNMENQKSELESQKSELESQKVSLESQEADLENQQTNLDAQINAKKAASSDYASQIETAKQQAAQISNLIAQQDAEIQRLAEERVQREREEARRQEEARQQQIANQSQQRPSSGSQSSNNSAAEEPSYSSGGSSGSAIVAYADQFVGNPYVWGGNSLTNGIDCSHFVYQVLKNCGVYSGGYTTSAGWRSLGRSVGSLSQAKAGDVICYSGHVAIYDGYGGIVEAKGSKWGITHDRSASHATILAIRRFT